MSTLPAANYLTDNARTEGEFKAGLEAMLAATKQIPGAGVAELAITIAAGSITPAGSGGALVIDTESAAASDDLANIVQTNYPDGSMLLLRNANAARFVVCKHAATGAGQLLLARSADYVLDDTKKFLLLQRRSTDWVEVYRSPNRLTMPVVAKTATFTIQKEDHGKVFLCSGGGYTVNFAAAAQLGDGFSVSVVNLQSLGNTITLDPSGSETVDGRTALLLRNYEGVLLTCDGVSLSSIGKRHKPRYAQVSFASSLTIEPTDAENFEVGDLTGNITTLTMGSSYAGTRIRIRFKQDATGGRTVASPSGAKITGSVDATASKVSYLDLYYSVLDLRWEGFWSTVPV